MHIPKILIFLFISLSTSFRANAQQKITFTIENATDITSVNRLYKAGNPLIQYYGRIQKTNVDLPRFWSSGVYIKAKFDGNNCSFFLNDQVLYGNVHNYVGLIVDGKSFRFQTKFASNKITLHGLKKSKHTITICKDTESGNGYLEFGGIACNKLLELPKEQPRKIEFIGNSITCGFGADASKISCGKGQWYDQHNAYMAYGPLTARALNAQWELASVSGIGMIHSCCDMKILMPQVYDKLDMRDDSIAYDFNEYIPDLVTICLGQNDGIQDSTAFCSAYVDFVKTIRKHYSHAKVLLLTSPMADDKLRAVLKNYLSSIKNYFQNNGDQGVYEYAFNTRYHHGCGEHPDLEEHRQISNQIVQFIQKNQLLQ